jgi:hypothetical protein
VKMDKQMLLVLNWKNRDIGFVALKGL